MKIHSKVFFGIGILCGAFASDYSAKAVLVEPVSSNAPVETAAPAVTGGYYSFAIDATATLDTVATSTPAGQSLQPVAPVSSVATTDFAVPYVASASSGAPEVDAYTRSASREPSVARIIILVPEVSSVLPLAGVLGLILGGRHLRRPRRLAGV